MADWEVAAVVTCIAGGCSLVLNTVEINEYKNEK